MPISEASQAVNRFQHMGPTDELLLFNKSSKIGLDHTEDLAVLLGRVLQYFSDYYQYGLRRPGLFPLALVVLENVPARGAYNVVPTH